MPYGPRTWSCTTWLGCSIHAAPFRCAGGRTCKHDASFDNKHGQLARPLRAPVARSSSSFFWLHLAYHHSGILRRIHRLPWGIQSDSRPPTPRCMRLVSVRMQPSTAAWTTRTPTPSTCRRYTHACITACSANTWMLRQMGLQHLENTGTGRSGTGMGLRV